MGSLNSCAQALAENQSLEEEEEEEEEVNSTAI